MTSLPIEVDIRTHGTLDDEIAEVQVVEIITAVAQGERLELVYTWLLVGEELVLVLFVIGVKTLVGIEHH